jgi:hypothetical protein
VNNNISKTPYHNLSHFGKFIIAFLIEFGEKGKCKFEFLGIHFAGAVIFVGNFMILWLCSVQQKINFMV